MLWVYEVRVNIVISLVTFSVMSVSIAIHTT